MAVHFLFNLMNWSFQKHHNFSLLLNRWTVLWTNPLRVSSSEQTPYLLKREETFSYPMLTGSVKNSLAFSDRWRYKRITFSNHQYTWFWQVAPRKIISKSVCCINTYSSTKVDPIKEKIRCILQNHCNKSDNATSKVSEEMCAVSKSAACKWFARYRSGNFNVILVVQWPRKVMKFSNSWARSTYWQSWWG